MSVLKDLYMFSVSDEETLLIKLEDCGGAEVMFASSTVALLTVVFCPSLASSSL